MRTIYEAFAGLLLALAGGLIILALTSEPEAARADAPAHQVEAR